MPPVIYYWVFKDAVVGESRKRWIIIGVTIIIFVCASSLSPQSSSLQSLTRVHSFLLTWERIWNISSDPWARGRTTQWAPFTCSSAASCNPSSHNNVRSNITKNSLLNCLVRVCLNRCHLMSMLRFYLFFLRYWKHVSKLWSSTTLSFLSTVNVLVAGQWHKMRKEGKGCPLVVTGKSNTKLDLCSRIVLCLVISSIPNSSG